MICFWGFMGLLTVVAIVVFMFGVAVVLLSQDG